MCFSSSLSSFVPSSFRSSAPPSLLQFFPLGMGSSYICYFFTCFFTLTLIPCWGSHGHTPSSCVPSSLSPCPCFYAGVWYVSVFAYLLHALLFLFHKRLQTTWGDVKSYPILAGCQGTGGCLMNAFFAHWREPPPPWGL